MGFLDSVLGSLLNSGSGTSGGTAPNAVAQMLENLVQQHGGIAGLITQLAQGGLGQHTASWVGTGANMPVSGTQVTQALGNSKVAEIAQKLGIDPNQAGSLLAQVLPHVIDHMTPNGQVPTGAAAQGPSSNMLSAALSALTAKL